MMLLARPQLRQPGEAVIRAFDVSTLASLGGLIGLSASNQESRPDLLAAAEAELARQGTPSICREEILYYPTGPVYNRICDPIGGTEGGYIGADVVAAGASGPAWYRDLMANVNKESIARMESDEVDPFVDPNWRPGAGPGTPVSTAQQTEFERQARQALVDSAPGYTQYQETVRQAEAAQRQVDRTATGSGTAADRQPGTMETVGAEGPVVEGGGFLGLDTTTLMLLGIGAIGLMVAMKGK